MRDETREKENALLLSIASNAFLLLLSIITAFATGLASVAAIALHSANDFIFLAGAYLRGKNQAAGQDAGILQEPKAPSIAYRWAGLILVLITGLCMIYIGITRLLEEQYTRFIEAGIALMIVSAAVKFFVSLRLAGKTRRLKQAPVEAGTGHLRADGIASAGVAAALLLTRATDFWWIDPAAAVLLGVWTAGIFVRHLAALVNRPAVTEPVEKEKTDGKNK